MDIAFAQSTPYLTNVNQSSHEVLVAERIYGLLSLLPGGIFYNAALS